jgi:hypothetical protein
MRRCLLLLLYLSWGQGLLAQATPEKVKLSRTGTRSSLATAPGTHIQQPDRLPSKSNAGNTSHQPVSPASDSLWLSLLPSFSGYFQTQYPKFKRLTPNEGLSHGRVLATGLYVVCY